MKAVFLSVFFTLVLCETSFLALNKACEGWFCETEHIELIMFTTEDPSSYTKLATVYPSGAYARVEQLTAINTYDPSTTTYFCVVQDPSSSKAFLWSYNLQTKKTAQSSIAFGASNINWDPKTKTILASYQSDVYQVSPATGLRKKAFEVYSPSDHPSFVPLSVSYWKSSTGVFSETVLDKHSDSSANCYTVYTVNTQTNKTTTSACFPYAPDSLGDYSTLWMNEISGQFFAVTYNALGANYQFLNPGNFSVVETVLDFQDFAGIGWSVNPVTSTFSYNPLSSMLWASVDLSEDDGAPTTILGGVEIPTGSVLKTAGSIGDWTNIQVVYQK